MATTLTARVRIFDVEFDDLDLAGVVRAVDDGISAGRGGWIVTPNVDILRQIAADAQFAELISGATLVIVDGAPVQWAGRIAGHKGVQRAPGASLALPLAAAARDRGVPVLLLGGRPGAGEQAAANLQAALPGIRVNDHCPDYGFEADPAKWDQVREAVRANVGGIVLCGFGCPKQERVMHRLYAEFPDTWFLGIGGTIDFLAGFVPRAPEWMQQVGFEWAYRLAAEPKRLARRYLVDGFPFAWRLMVWAAKERQQTAAVRRGNRALPAPALPATMAPARVLPVVADAGQIEIIDLDRRTVVVTAVTPGDVSVEIGFTEFLAQRKDVTARAQVTAPEHVADRVIDLRDGSRLGSADATRTAPSDQVAPVPAPRPATQPAVARPAGSLEPPAIAS